MPKNNIKHKARSSASRMGKMVGIGKDGIHAGKLTTAGGIALLAAMPGYKAPDGITYSIIDVVMGKGTFATATTSYKMEVSLMIAGSLLYGRMPAGQTAATLPNAKMCGYLIAGGITMTIIGHWLNGFLRGSPIKF